MFNISTNIRIYVFLIHIVISFLAYLLIQTFDTPIDAYFYWFEEINGDEFLSYKLVPLREYFILYINYPLAILLDIPFEIGFVIYAFIGFLGWLIYYKTLRLQIAINNPLSFGLMIIILSMPSFHFWTSLPGKEPLCFVCLSMIFYKIYQKQYKSFYVIVSLILLGIIRPHVLAILIVSFYLLFLMKSSKSILFKSLLSIGVLMTCLGLGYILFKSHPLSYFNLENIQLLINNHHDVLKTTEGYVPIEEYNIFYKVFTFYFRPMLGEDFKTLYLISGIENTICLILIIFGLFCFLKTRKKFNFKLKDFEIVIILYTSLLAIILSLAYSNFGLISRMKVMGLPFIFFLVLNWINTYYSKSEKIHA